MICLVVAESDLDSAWATINNYPAANLYELRLDFLSESDENIARFVTEVKKKTSKPLILTNRHMNEGGNSYKPERERISLLLRCLDARPDFVDIELYTESSLRNELISEAKRQNIKVIISYHNFNLTPELNALLDIINQAKDLDADIIKITTLARDRGDLLRILRLYEATYDDRNKLLAFNMGELGKVSRVMALFLGAPFMYVSKECNCRPAPGQLSISEFTTLLSILEEK